MKFDSCIFQVPRGLGTRSLASVFLVLIYSVPLEEGSMKQLSLGSKLGLCVHAIVLLSTSNSALGDLRMLAVNADAFSLFTVKYVYFSL